jgi:hypothetical protein
MTFNGIAGSFRTVNSRPQAVAAERPHRPADDMAT